MADPLLRVGWDEIATPLVGSRVAYVSKAVDVGLRRALADAAPSKWEWEDLEHGTFRSYGMVNNYALLEQAPSVVGEVAEHITDNVAQACGIDVPRFHYVNWTRWPQGSGHITAHRDPPGVGGILAVITLRGSAPFHVDTNHGVQEWIAAAGDLVIMAGNGWPDRADLCPVHGVEPPTHGERMIVTFRHKRGGPDSDVFAYRDGTSSR